MNVINFGLNSICIALPPPVSSWTPSCWCPTARTGSRSPPGWGCSSRGSRRQPTATEAEETVVISQSDTFRPSHFAPFLLWKLSYFLLLGKSAAVFCALSSGIFRWETDRFASEIIQQKWRAVWKVSNNIDETSRIYSLKSITVRRAAKNM